MKQKKTEVTVFISLGFSSGRLQGGSLLSGHFAVYGNDHAVYLSSDYNQRSFG